jgi:hypothetical protein
MTNLPEGCFWGVKQPFDPNIYFQLNSFQLLKQEKLTSNNLEKLKKIWRRKYMFFGSIHAASMIVNSSFFFFESHPGQLYHCDIPNAKISEMTKQMVYCFFWVPSSKSVGLKMYQNKILIRHIESEIDYSLCINQGKKLENEDELIAISKVFNPQQLLQYLQNLNIAIPEPMKPSSDLNSTLYTLIR